LTLDLTLDEVARGVEKDVQLTRPRACATCHGSGAATGTTAERCGACQGTGQVRQVQRSVFGQFVQVGACPECRGQGTRIKDPCRSCGGDGRTRVTETIQVRIPAGMTDGTRLRVPQGGEAGPRGAPTGDLFVQVRIRPDDRYERDGKDLHTVLPVRYKQATLGDEVTLEDVLGRQVQVKIPNGSHHGLRLKIRGHGLPGLNGSAPGDLYIHLHVEVPKKISKEAKEHLEAFDRAVTQESGGGATGFFRNLFNKGNE
jgi:molecular chaperone DnaJ